MSEVVNAAHRALEFQPGEDIADDEATRKVAQGLKQTAIGIGEIRNLHGTGHGRAAPTGILEEHAELAAAAASAWSKWALRRLEPYIAGDVTALVRDLDGEIFTRGKLRRRLKFANLPRLSPEDQHRLGFAVGRRASQDTYVVIEDGVEAVDPADPNRWPAGYVEGLINGLIFDRNGYLDLSPDKIAEVARLVGALPDSLTYLRGLANGIGEVGEIFRSSSDQQHLNAVVDEWRRMIPTLPSPDGQRIWNEMLGSLTGA
jgi:hypothetical protein